MVFKCCIPGCKNYNKDAQMHIFPKEQELYDIWIDKIGRHDLKEKPMDCVRKSYRICNIHFGPESLYIGSRYKSTITKVAVPSLYIGKHGNVNMVKCDPHDATLSTTSQDPVSKEISDKTVSNENSQPTTPRSSYQAGVQQKIDSVVEIEAIRRGLLAKTSAQSKPSASKEIVNNRPNKMGSVKKQEDQNQDNKVHGSYNSMCRLCMGHFSEMDSIYNKADGRHTVAFMISVCLNPIQISPTDKLSKFICAKCLRSVKEYFKFHQFCLGMDAKQRELISIEQEYPSDGHDADSDNSEEYLHEERLSDYEENKENKDDTRSAKTNGQIFKRRSGDEEKCREDQNTNRKSEIDIKFDKVEEELVKVLEGGDDVDITESENTTQTEGNTLLQSEGYSSYGSKIPNKTIVKYDPSKKNVSNQSKSLSTRARRDDDIYTENIIIEMINDEDTQQAPPNIKLPITIKRIISDTPKKTPVKRKRTDMNSLATSDQNVTMIKSENSEEIVVLPRGISVEVKEKYQSPLGTYGYQGVKYLFNSEFLLAGGYLYEYWLATEKIRNLHCVVARCPGAAVQSRISYHNYSSEIEVIKAHNHEPPDAMERKRQMFYNIMYSKMRKDRNFNFKHLYEKFCHLDHDLTDILPLRKVISEICKQGPIVQPPVVLTFEQFYNSIDDDSFHKIHFTDHHVQFYQEKFKSDDGGRAVVFANPEVVKFYSYSKLMYVDASFHIEPTNFPYMLLTVLVWVSESYYPIFYAFLNKKSQDLYRQIFSFLYNTLAPNLRPDEIITDYEANVYYALGETYIESSIGGSMFYFTQNLYKKICSLNLARELDLNSNFRSIYNMLLMLPLLPVNTILDALNNIEVQAKELGLQHLTKELFMHVHNEWMCKVTPDFFCVHRLENRINENIVAPFKKLRDLILLAKSKSVKTVSTSSVVHIIEKIIELEKFLRDTYSGFEKKNFAKDLSSSQKKIVLKAWNFIENHPKININHFFLKVLGYIKCLENQNAGRHTLRQISQQDPVDFIKNIMTSLWIWGFYRYQGDTDDELINANNFSIVNEVHHKPEEELQEDAPMEEIMEEERLESQEEDEEEEQVIEEFYVEDSGTVRRVTKNSSKLPPEELSDKQPKAEPQEPEGHSEKEQPAVLMEAVIDENGSFVLQNTTNPVSTDSTDNNVFVYK